jgi:hypothetical protein
MMPYHEGNEDWVAVLGALVAYDADLKAVDNVGPLLF